MPIQLINIGFGNIVSANRVIAIVSPESAPIKRIIQEARDHSTLIDATYGRRTRAVIITDSGDVYKRQGDIIRVELLNAEEGATIELDQVLAVGNGADLKIGNPTVAGAKVSLKVLEHGKGKKVVVFHYKPKKKMCIRDRSCPH